MKNTDVRDDYHALVRKDVLDLVPDGRNAVLDIGGGIGASAGYLKEVDKAERYVVVDLVADAKHASVDAAYSGNLEDPALLQRIEAEQGVFDVILCLDVLEHLTDPWSVIEACHAMLKPGGVIVASIPNARNHRLVIPLVFKGRFEYTEKGILDRTHLRWFVRDTAIQLMTGTGLELEHIEGQFYGRRKRLVNWLTMGLLKNFIYLQYFIRVRRNPSERLPNSSRPQEQP
ncbi:class I SAM-dependent methyltransferase [Ruegeria sp.]|uniref:class I SAM-dependent methyltransferase n=1 Tax=Ruegeria sp. TaxID=1879320 RepID=UPI003B58F819